MSKKFGQNFLVNRRSRERIHEELMGGKSPLSAGEGVWEIGPGVGAMTAHALGAGLSLTAFEIDHGFARLLTRVYGAEPRFRLVEGDFLKTWKPELAASGPPAAIFGNLPYNVANAIVAELLEGGLVPRRLVFTVQKEAALRMAAKPGGKDYSAFSVLCTSVCKVRIAFDLGASSFWPAPNVTSSVVVLEPRPEPLGAGDRKGFSAFVRAGFATRRKTLKNNLKAWGRSEGPVQEALSSLGIREDVRAEALKPEELLAVYEALRTVERGGGPAAAPGG